MDIPDQKTDKPGKSLNFLPLLSSRAKAKAAGESLYRDLNEPCEILKFHDGSRYTQTGECRACLQDAFHISNQNDHDTPRTKLQAQERGWPFYTPSATRLCKRGPHLFAPMVDHHGRCFSCRMDRETGKTPDVHTGDRDGARTAGLPYYFDNTRCKNGHLSSRYTRTGICLMCARNAPLPTDVIVVNDREADVDAQTRRGTRRDAQRAGSKYYRDGNRCRAGHLSPRYTSNGVCVTCAGHYTPDDRSGDEKIRAQLDAEKYAEIDAQTHSGPQPEAVRLRKPYYYGPPCKEGHLSPRYTSSRACLACAGRYPPVFTSAPLNDMSTQTWAGTREQAKAFGFKFYRDGKQCKLGHLDAIRYASTGGCYYCQRTGSYKGAYPEDGNPLPVIRYRIEPVTEVINGQTLYHFPDE